MKKLIMALVLLASPAYAGNYFAPTISGLTVDTPQHAATILSNLGGASASALTTEAATARANEAAALAQAQAAQTLANAALPASSAVTIGTTAGHARDAAAAIAAETAAQNAANTANSGLSSINAALSSTPTPNSILKFGNISGQPLVQLTTQPLNFGNSSTATALPEDINIIDDNTNNTGSASTQALNITVRGSSATTGNEDGILDTVNDNGTTGTQLVQGEWIQVNKTALSQSGDWTILGQMRDQTGLNSAAEGPGGILSQEWDISSSLADDRINPAHWWGHSDRSGTEWVFGINQQASTIASSVEFGSGLFFTQNTTGTVVDSVLDFGPGGGGNVGFQTYNVLDTMNTIPPTGSSNPVNAIIMPSGEDIEFAGDLKGGSLTAAPQRALSYVSADAAWEYFINGLGKAFGVLDSGAFEPNFGLTLTDNAGASGAHFAVLQTNRPTITGCTGCTLDAHASDVAGTLTEGTSQTGAVLAFEHPYATAPHCNVTPISALAASAFTSATPSTTGLTIANGSMSNTGYTYECIQ